MRVVVAGSDITSRSLITGTITEQKRLNLFIVGQASSVEEVGRITLEGNPGLILWDIEGQEERAMAIVEKIKMQQPRIKVVIINNRLELKSVRAALYNGIDDYLVKPLTPKELINSLIRITFDHMGVHYVPDVVDRALRYMQKNLAKPITLNEVAEECFISPCYLSRLIRMRTGKTFVQNLQTMRLIQAEWLPGPVVSF